MALATKLMRLAPQARRFSTRSAVLAKKYTKSHEWVDFDQNGSIATVGITTYAAKALGDVVYVELPELKIELEKDTAMGAIESVKSASDIYAPVSGTVIEINSALEEKPAIINKEAESAGWLAKFKVNEGQDLEHLMTKEEYDALDKDEGH